MTKSPSPGAIAWSLFLAFLGGIVTVYVVEVASAITEGSRFDPFFSFVLFPLLGAVVAVPICVVVTLAVWGCLVIGNRWVRTSTVGACVLSAVLAAVVCSVLYLLIVLILPTLREPPQLLAYALAVIVVVAISLLRGVGRHGAAATAAPLTRDSSS